MSIIILTLQLHSYLITRQPLHVATAKKKMHVVVYALVHCFYFTMSSLFHTHTLHCPHFFFLIFSRLNLKPLDLRLIFLSVPSCLIIIFLYRTHTLKCFWRIQIQIYIRLLIVVTFAIAEVSSSLCKFAISRYFILYLFSFKRNHLLLFFSLYCASDGGNQRP